MNSNARNADINLMLQKIMSNFTFSLLVASNDTIGK